MPFVRSINANQDDWLALEKLLDGANKSLVFQLLVKAVLTGQIKIDIKEDRKQIILLEQVAIDMEGIVYDLMPEPSRPTVVDVPPAPAPSPVPVQLVSPVVPVPVPVPVSSALAIAPVSPSAQVLQPDEPEPAVDLTDLLEEGLYPDIKMSPSILAVQNILKFLSTNDGDDELINLAKSELVRLQDDPESDFDQKLEQGLQLAMEKSTRCGLL